MAPDFDDMIPKGRPFGLADMLQKELETVARTTQEAFEAQALVEDERAGLAYTMFEALRGQVEDFEKRLKTTEEVGAILANFGSTTRMVVTGMGYRHPHLIILVGEDEDGRAVEVCQHVAQVSLLFRAVSAKGEKPRRVGFRLGDAAEDGSP